VIHASPSLWLAWVRRLKIYSPRRHGGHRGRQEDKNRKLQAMFCLALLRALRVSVVNCLPESQTLDQRAVVPTSGLPARWGFPNVATHHSCAPARFPRKYFHTTIVALTISGGRGYERAWRLACATFTLGMPPRSDTMGCGDNLVRTKASLSDNRSSKR